MRASRRIRGTLTLAPALPGTQAATAFVQQSRVVCALVSGLASDVYVGGKRYTGQHGKYASNGNVRKDIGKVALVRGFSRAMDVICDGKPLAPSDRS